MSAGTSRGEPAKSTFQLSLDLNDFDRWLESVRLCGFQLSLDLNAAAGVVPPGDYPSIYFQLSLDLNGPATRAK